jgi:hypothetical protein
MARRECATRYIINVTSEIAVNTEQETIQILCIWYFQYFDSR